MTADRGRERLLVTLERLLAIEATDLHAALDEATQLVSDALRADKVDVLLCDGATETLVAVGTSDTPMGRRQKAIGLDRLPLANGGRAAQVFTSGEPYSTGRADADPEELRGITQGLGIRSELIVPLDVAGQRRGVLLVSSEQPDFFAPGDLEFLLAVGRWVGMVTHRAELAERMAADAAQQGRRMVAEELMAVLAHDLRNHLTPLRGRLELMLRRATREGRERDVRDGREAVESVHRLDRMIGDLLDVARLEQGVFGLTLQAVDLTELVREAVEALHGGTTQVDVLVPDDEVCAQVDPNRVRQALENLLANAVRYSPEGTPVTVRLEPLQRGADAWAAIHVVDQGPGIPPELLPRLFSRFAAGAGSTGLGLGLYLASRIAAAHGGTLEVDAGARRGAHFVLALPCGERVPEAAP